MGYKHYNILMKLSHRLNLYHVHLGKYIQDTILNRLYFRYTYFIPLLPKLETNKINTHLTVKEHRIPFNILQYNPLLEHKSPNLFS